MVRRTGQIIRRGSSTWLVRIYVGRDPETRKRKYIGKFIHGGLRPAQAHLNRMLAERDLGRNIRSSRQTVGQYLNHWLDICARLRLRAKSFRDYRSLLARYVRARLGEWADFGDKLVSESLIREAGNTSGTVQTLKAPMPWDYLPLVGLAGSAINKEPSRRQKNEQRYPA